jgi:hypothetical protein
MTEQHKENQIAAEKAAAKGQKLNASRQITSNRAIPPRKAVGQDADRPQTVTFAPNQVKELSSHVKNERAQKRSPGRKVTFSSDVVDPCESGSGLCKEQQTFQSETIVAPPSQGQTMSDLRRGAPNGPDLQKAGAIVVNRMERARDAAENDPRRDFEWRKIKVVSFAELEKADDRFGALRSKLCSI